MTVVDAVNLLNDYASHDFLKDRGEVLGDDDERTLVHLLTDQIEFADVVVLNKVADAGLDRVDAARKIIRSLNADAEIIETNQSAVPVDKILDTGLFDFEKAHDHPMWVKELYGFADHTPETEEYGVSSFVYRARRPFIPQKIMAILNGNLPGVIRAKGHFWISSRPDWVAEFSLAGALSTISPLGTWWASIPEERRPDHESARTYMQAHWQEPWGDRRQELVFIGAGIDWPQIKLMLDDCLVPESLAKPADPTRLSRYFPNMETPGGSGMNQVTTRVKAVPTGVVMQPFQYDVERFKAPDCAALIMQRRIPDKTAQWLTELPVDKLPSGRVTAAVDELRYVIEQICSIAKMPRCAERSWLEADILEMAERFAD